MYLHTPRCKLTAMRHATCTRAKRKRLEGYPEIGGACGDVCQRVRLGRKWNGTHRGRSEARYDLKVGT
eukprot:1987845-Pyramimonas_sp.AAC.1